MLGQARVLFAMAEDGLLPPQLALVHAHFRTPHVATLLTGACACAIAGLFPIEVLGELVAPKGVALLPFSKAVTELVCDVQERFAPLVHRWPAVVHTSRTLVRAAVVLTPLAQVTVAQSCVPSATAALMLTGAPPPRAAEPTRTSGPAISAAPGAEPTVIVADATSVCASAQANDTKSAPAPTYAMPAASAAASAEADGNAEPADAAVTAETTASTGGEASIVRPAEVAFTLRPAAESLATKVAKTTAPSGGGCERSIACVTAGDEVVAATPPGLITCQPPDSAASPGLRPYPTE
jgi:hypothetical protein